MDSNKSSKGFVFALDALLSVIILVVSIAGLYFLSSQVEKNYFGELMLKKQSGDLLSALDKSGALASQNATLIGQSVSSLAPSGMRFNLTVAYFSYSGGFAENSTYSIGSPLSNASLKAASERAFLADETGGVQKYGIATLVAWQSPG